MFQLPEVISPWTQIESVHEMWLARSLRFAMTFTNMACTNIQNAFESSGLDIQTAFDNDDNGDDDNAVAPAAQRIDTAASTQPHTCINARMAPRLRCPGCGWRSVPFSCARCYAAVLLMLCCYAAVLRCGAAVRLLLCCAVLWAMWSIREYSTTSPDTVGPSVAGEVVEYKTS
jgi:hypothetical protein